MAIRASKKSSPLSPQSNSGESEVRLAFQKPFAVGEADESFVKDKGSIWKPGKSGLLPTFWSSRVFDLPSDSSSAPCFDPCTTDRLTENNLVSFPGFQIHPSPLPGENLSLPRNLTADLGQYICERQNGRLNVMSTNSPTARKEMLL